MNTPVEACQGFMPLHADAGVLFVMAGKWTSYLHEWTFHNRYIDGYGKMKEK